MFPLVSPRYIAVKSFLLAMLFHLSLLSLFTLTMSVRSAPPEPLFVFLGSILTKHDLTGPGSLDTAYEIGQIHFPVSDAAVTPKITAKDLPVQYNKKPSSLEQSSTTLKKTYKDTRGLSASTATTPLTEKKGETTEAAPLKIQLKLYPNDQN